jgi:hypothetical protein
MRPLFLSQTIHILSTYRARKLYNRGQKAQKSQERNIHPVRPDQTLYDGPFQRAKVLVELLMLEGRR